MAEKDINAETKTDTQEAPAMAGAIDGYDEVSRGGNGIFSKYKAKFMIFVTGVTLFAGFHAYNEKNPAQSTEARENRNAMEYAILGLSAMGALAVPKNTANYKEHLTKGRE